MALRIRRGTDAQRTGHIFETGELVWTTDGQQLWVGDGVTAGGSPVVSGHVAGYGLVYDSGSKKLEVAGLTADDISTEGTNNKFFDPVLARTAIGAGFTEGSGSSNVQIIYDDVNDLFTANVTLDGVGISAIVEDANPTLGGDLDLNEFNITGIGNVSITGNVTASGNISTGSITNTSLEINIGSATAPNNLVINGDQSTPSLVLKTGLTGSAGLEQLGPIFQTYAHRGTSSLPTPLTLGDSLGQVNFQGKINAGSYGVQEADLASIKATINNAGNLTDTVATGKLQFIVLNGPDPAQVKIAEFDNAGVFTAPRLMTDDGSATHPSIGFTTDGSQDTGLFHPGDGIMCVSTDGTERARFDNGGLRVNGFMKVAQVNGTLPSPPEAGMIVLDGTTFKGYNGTSWVSLN